ncbi:hypothetical protein ASG20_17855 [Sphingomonas sp. Leaf198]|nr:hypothetical protein ASG20_17855 [Sphingomonas sp. Leaf198]
MIGGAARTLGGEARDVKRCAARASILGGDRTENGLGWVQLLVILPVCGGSVMAGQSGISDAGDDASPAEAGVQLARSM